MTRRILAVIVASVALVTGIGFAANAAGQGAHKCHVIAFRVPGQPAGDSLAAFYRADKTDYFTKTVVERYSPRTRWAFVSVVPKHC